MQTETFTQSDVRNESITPLNTFTQWPHCYNTMLALTQQSFRQGATTCLQYPYDNMTQQMYTLYC